MAAKFFVAIDFDGTITGTDITDAVIQRFARPGWEDAEQRWEEGLIGSRECLFEQMSLIDAPMDAILEYVDTFTIDPAFPGFVEFLKRHGIPHCVVSDGFKAFSERVLRNAGIDGMAIYANELKEEGGRVRTYFPHSKAGCPSGVCKCMVAGEVGGGVPVILIGDGRSDFCLAGKAAYIFSKRRLARHCMDNAIAHTVFETFSDVKKHLEIFVMHMRKGRPAAEWHHQLRLTLETKI